MRQAAVSFFGAFPAAVLCMPLLGVLIGSVGEYVESGNLESLLLSFWCVFGLIGTVALFFSIEAKPKPITMIGLGLGIAAVVGGGGLSLSPSIWKWLIVAPMITAIVLILEGLFAPSTDVDEFYG